eukprot:Skav204426  [mRNA]  locus=scaffold3703:16531:17624:+ [translate_table: standard]
MREKALYAHFAGSERSGESGDKETAELVKEERIDVELKASEADVRTLATSRQCPGQHEGTVVQESLEILKTPEDKKSLSQDSKGRDSKSSKESKDSETEKAGKETQETDGSKEKESVNSSGSGSGGASSSRSAAWQKNSTLSSDSECVR